MGFGFGLAKGSCLVDGSSNFLQAMSIPRWDFCRHYGRLVASFAGTTLDTACRLQRYVIQELAGTLSRGNQAPGFSKLSFNPFSLAHQQAWCHHFCGDSCFVHCSLPKGSPEISLGQAWNAEIPSSFLEDHPETSAAASEGGFAGLGWWFEEYAGKGGLLLWPLFGATNQLLAGLAFLVIAFYLWRRNIPTWFIIIPMIFMLLVPAWAMLTDIPKWVNSENPNWLVITIGTLTLALEGWMLLEACLIWPRVKGILESRDDLKSKNDQAV